MARLAGDGFKRAGVSLHDFQGNISKRLSAVNHGLHRDGSDIGLGRATANFNFALCIGKGHGIRNSGRGNGAYGGLHYCRGNRGSFGRSDHGRRFSNGGRCAPGLILRGHVFSSGVFRVIS